MTDGTPRRDGRPGVVFLVVAAVLGALVTFAALTLFDRGDHPDDEEVTTPAEFSLAASRIVTDFGPVVVLLGSKDEAGRFVADGVGFFFEPGRILTTAVVADAGPTLAVDAEGRERGLAGTQPLDDGFVTVSTQDSSTPSLVRNDSKPRVEERVVLLSVLDHPFAPERSFLKNVASIAAVDGDDVTLLGSGLDTPGSAPVFDIEGTLVAIVANDGDREQVRTAHSVLDLTDRRRPAVRTT